ncbi:hypothetical protein ABT358_02470 [Streptomyces sp. NPDC000341]|uniref:hypothetical protein n=1 Tax=Streptomyces sp. NPDC000341 TaxID=3156645 RepID=UPI00333172A1
MSDVITIQPTRELLVPFARWAVAQSPRVRTDSVNSFAVPAHLFAGMPEDILVGSLVDGHRYVSPAEDARTGTPAPGELLGVSRRVAGEARLLACGLCYEEDGEEVHPHPACSLSAPQTGEREAVPGDVLPEAPASGNDPDSAPLAPWGDEDDGAADGEPPAESAPFVCDLCPRDYPTARGRDTHRRQKHPEA